jgi:hypothetical protein
MAAEDRHEEVFTDEECIDCTERERSFDTLTRGLANGSISRRKALRVLGASLVGSVLAAIPGVALAKPPLGTCLKEGKPCQTNTDCCSQNCETKKGKLVCGPAVQCTGSGQGNCPQPANQPCLQVLCNNGFCGAVQAKPNGQGCDDGNQCTVNDTCQGGNCTPGGPRNCDDNDVCTTDTCVPATGCVHTPIPGCCRNNAECDDDNECTTDTCEGNIGAGEGVCVNTPIVCEDNDVCTTNTCDPQTGCVHTPIPGCCRNDSECQDGNPCTTNTCEGDIAAGGGVCVSTGVPDCCQTDADCDDLNACTTDTCDQTTNTCVFTPIVCEDNDVCTTNTCDPATGCVFTEIPNCCEVASDCDDDDVCTTDTCVANQCVHTPVANCCTTDAQCNDDDVCTTDTCVANQCVHTPVANCCTTDAQCNDNNVCTTDTCVANQCVHTPVANNTTCTGGMNPRRCCGGVCCQTRGMCTAITGTCPS